MPTRYFCTRYKFELTLVGENKGIEKFRSPDGKQHQCIKFDGKNRRQCRKLELRSVPV